MTSIRISIASLLIASTLLLSCGKPPAPLVRPTIMSVTTAVVRTETIPLKQSYPGIVASPRSIEIDARVEGFLLKQEVADGSATKPGQVIYRIDPKPFEASLAASEGSLVQAIAQRDYAKKEMDRNAPLVVSSAISQQDFDKLVENFAAAEGQVLTAQANVLTAKINLSYCTMSSPFVGLLGASQFFEGAVVGNPNTTNLNSLVQIDPLWAQFSPSATEWPKYAALMAKGPLQATVTFDGADSISAVGKIVFADNQVSTSTSTLMMRVEFNNPNLIFRPGVYADVEVDLGAQPNVLVVPEQAVFAREADLYVWRVKADNTVESVQIKILKKVGSMVALISGPQVGDRIVVEGIQRLKTGTKILDTTNATPAPAPVAPATTIAPAPAPAPQTK